MSSNAVDYWVAQGPDETFTGIDYAHNNTHLGKSFMAGHLASSLATTPGTLDVMLQTATTHEVHLIFNLAVGADMEFCLHEDITATAAGTALTAFNKNRLSTATSTVTVTHTPTVTDTGTAFPCIFMPGGDGSGAGAGGATPGYADGGFSREIILKKGANYLLRITNTAANTAPASIIAEWYELAR